MHAQVLWLCQGIVRTDFLFMGDKFIADKKQKLTYVWYYKNIDDCI